MTTTDETWTPYGLEAIRIAHLRRRRLITALVVIGIALIWTASVGANVEPVLEITAQGQAGGATILFPGDEDQKDKPITVAVTPGRMTMADTAQQEPAAAPPRQQVPTFGPARAVDWSTMAMVYSPYLLIGLALWLLGRKPGKHDELNYGIYKGSMPFEMITASASRQVFTKRETRASIFGKRAADHVPREMVVIERMPAQEDA